MTRSKRKRGSDGPSHDGGCSDGGDADDVSESSIQSCQSKGAGRTAVQCSPRHNISPRRNVPSRCSVSQSSKKEEIHHQVPGDRHTISSLSNMETIPIQGFLTREILLSKVVYSITFEERPEHPTPACMSLAELHQIVNMKLSAESLPGRKSPCLENQIENLEPCPKTTSF